MENREIHSAVVTGATGAIGAALCRVLPDAGIEVFAVVRPDSKRARNLPESERLHLIACDLRQMEALPKILKGKAVDAFFHLGWDKTTGSGRNDMKAQIDNVRCTLDAVHAAAEMGCCVFVGAGSQAEYGRVEGALRPETPCFPENGYGMAKLCAGQMSRVECKKLGIDHIWARILSVYGPCDGEGSMISGTIRRLLCRECPALTAGEQIWDYLYSVDAARALYAMALRGRDGAVYPLGSGEARPLKKYVEELRDAIDPALPLGFGEIPYADKQVMALQADISVLQRDTGWTPETRFTDGIRQTIAWMWEKEKCEEKTDEQ